MTCQTAKIKVKGQNKASHVSKIRYFIGFESEIKLFTLQLKLVSFFAICLKNASYFSLF